MHDEYIGRNPCAMLHKEFPTSHKHNKNHEINTEYPALTEEADIKEFLDDLKMDDKLELATKRAIYLQILCVNRPGNTASAKWDDIKPGFMASVKFESAYLRIIIGILCFAACAFFAHLAFRPEKSIKYYPKFMRCKGCLKFYNFSDVKDRSVCPKCGGELQDYAEIEKSDQIEKNKKLERYYKFEKEWLKRVSHDKK